MTNEITHNKIFGQFRNMSASMITELQQTFLKVNIINLINERLYLSTVQVIKIALISEFTTTMTQQKANTDSHKNGYQNCKNIHHENIPI